MKIALFERASFAHAIALRLFSEADLIFCDSQDDIFCQLEDREISFGIVPFFNSRSGYNEETICHLITNGARILGKSSAIADYNLVGHDNAGKLFCRPGVHALCKETIDRFCPHCDIVYTSSNAEALKKTAVEEGLGLIPSFVETDLPIVAKGAQGAERDETSFVMVAKSGEPIGTKSTTLLILSNYTEELTSEQIQDVFDRNAIKVVALDSLFLTESHEEIYLIECSGPFQEEMAGELSDMCRVQVAGEYEVFLP